MRGFGGAVFSVVGATAAVACGSSGQGQVEGLNQGGQNVAAACAAIANLPCAEYSSASECENEANADRADAVQAGCGSQFDALVSCVASNPPTCGADGDLSFNQACYAPLEALVKCDPSSVCIGSSSSTSCSYQCGSAKVECDQVEGSWSCVCTAGPKTGTQFSPGLADGCDESSLGQHCE